MRRSAGLIPYIDLETDGVPIYEQIYRGLRTAILDGRLEPGTRLPSTRSLAEDLGIARMTAVRGYEILKAEGYIEVGAGAGTWVAMELPDRLIRAPAPSGPVPVAEPVAEPVASPQRDRSISERGEGLVQRAGQLFVGTGVRPFTPGIAAVDHFPHRTWNALEKEMKKDRESLRRSSLAGEERLRRAIATFVSGTRGGRIHPDQVVVTTSTNESLHLLAGLLVDPPDTMLFEDPGYRTARLIFEQACTVIPTPVDGEGMTVPDEAPPGARAPRLAYVTPSNQFPLGRSMSMARRRELLGWAERTGAWIIEDDYDGEYRFTGRPLPSLVSLDDRQCVIYVSGFRMLLSPVCQLAFMVLPPSLVEPVLVLKTLHARIPSTLLQLVLARFIEEGHFARHVRTMREVYRTRRNRLVETLRTELGGIELTAMDAGTHLVAWNPNGRSLGESACALEAAGIRALRVSDFAQAPVRRDGFVLGYGGFQPDDLEDAAKTLAATFR